MRSVSLILSTASLSLLLSLPNTCHSQGCSNRCPPVNFGKEVNALCEGDVIDGFADVTKSYSVCYPKDSETSQFALDDFRGEGKVTVIANYYSGCNAGRRESGVFAHVAQRFYEEYGGGTGGGSRVTFIQSIKGGGTCRQWASLYQEDGIDLYPDSNVIPKEMPLTIRDENYLLRDDLFTTPFGHPSYVILDGNLKIEHKFIGPCCGYESYYDCTADSAKRLDTQLTEYLQKMLGEATDLTNENGSTPAPTPLPPVVSPTPPNGCFTDEFSPWSECSVECGSTMGLQFRWRKVVPLSPSCPSPVETQPCTPPEGICGDEEISCVLEFGSGDISIEKVASGFNSPRDVAFHPTPGLHLGNRAEGRPFYPAEGGDEAWVVNGGNHSVSIVTSIGTDVQSTLSRRDRGYYHYMINGTALSFNSVKDSGRTPDRDALNYWAICNDNPNTYLDTKEPNYFMGPTLYNSDPSNGNTVNRLGDECLKEEPCYFLHADMLHEAPACIGIAHDPERDTSYGNVYWAFDATGDRRMGQLVRFDFQQPHGPGSMDHSVAAIRRYVEVELERGPPGVHAGMVVHPTRKEVYVAVPGSGQVLAIRTDSGSFARTAREEYPIYSNRLPSFEYSIWECADQRVFASGIHTPTGMALSNDGERIFVAERNTGKILVYDVASGSQLTFVNTGLNSIGGMAISPSTNELYFVDDDTNSLNKVKGTSKCLLPFASRINPSFTSELVNAREQIDLPNEKEDINLNSILFKDFKCTVDPVIPNSSFFDQVHDDTGYASDDPDVQSNTAGMDDTAALLANRTDCGYDSELNFDALLLGGYYCHTCLPELENMCDRGGTCSNIQWRGYTCDNEYRVVVRNEKVQIITTEGTIVEPELIKLKKDVTYRFTVLGDNEHEVCAIASSDNISVVYNDPALRLGRSNAEEDLTTVCIDKGPLLIHIRDETTVSSISLRDKNSTEIQLEYKMQVMDERVLWHLPVLITGIVVGVFIAIGTAFYFMRKISKKK